MSANLVQEDSFAEKVSFADRTAVAGNSSFLCLAVAAIWSFAFITKAALNYNTLLVLSAPLTATGLLVILSALTPSLVPKPTLTWPLPVTLPILWSLLCYLSILLITSAVSDTRVIPEPLIPAIAWTKLANLIPLCLLQMGALGLGAWVSKKMEAI